MSPSPLERKIAEIGERFEELQFASCPTEETEPFFWRWTDEGRKTLNSFLNTALLELLEVVKESLPKEREYDPDDERLSDPFHTDGYNHCLSDIKQILEVKEENKME